MSNTDTHSAGFDLERRRAEHTHVLVVGPYLSERAQARSPALIAQASELADLQRDHHIAEAVFSSALARIDTNKQDPFASYPLVQTLAEPSLPKRPSSPSLMIALAGALAASVLTIMAFALAWLRQPLLDRLLRKV